MRLAARLAPHSEMQLLHACQESFPAFLDSADRKVLVREQQEQVQDRLRADVQALSAELGSKSPKFEFVFDVGDPLSVIRQYCLENKPELIALGTHGRSGLAHAVVGSIAENLLADSDVDVSRCESSERVLIAGKQACSV